MKHTILDAYYAAIDDAKTIGDITEIGGMLYMLFMLVGQDGITMDDYHEAVEAKKRKLYAIIP